MTTRSSVVMDLPEGTVAVVLFAHGEHGDLLARYAEGRELVPAPRRQVIDALLRLALELKYQADELERSVPHDHR